MKRCRNAAGLRRCAKREAIEAARRAVVGQAALELRHRQQCGDITAIGTDRGVERRRFGGHIAAPVGVARLVQPCRLPRRSEEHTSEHQSLMRIAYAVFCLAKKRQAHTITQSMYTIILCPHTHVSAYN